MELILTSLETFYFPFPQHNLVRSSDEVGEEPHCVGQRQQCEVVSLPFKQTFIHSFHFQYHLYIYFQMYLVLTLAGGGGPLVQIRLFLSFPHSQFKIDLCRICQANYHFSICFLASNLNFLRILYFTIQYCLGFSISVLFISLLFYKYIL